MNTQDEDRDLRESFALQRREEEKQVTDFQRLLTLSPGRGRTTFVPVALAATVVVALVLAMGQLRHSEPVAPSAAQPATHLAAWTAPTAFLLRTPGHDLISTLPVFAGVPAQQERISTP